MAAVADAVTNVCGWITAYALPQNPAPAAKMIAALNRISGGRCGLNIVVEARKVEFEQIGAWNDSLFHDDRALRILDLNTAILTNSASVAAAWSA